MKNRSAFLVLLTLLMVAMAVGPTAAQLTRTSDPNLVSLPVRDQTMKRAFNRARATLPAFFRALSNPAPTQSLFAAKLAFRDQGVVEYIWLNRLVRIGNGFEGYVNNSPTFVRNVTLGQRVAFQRSQIVDWTYDDNGAMIGNFTACAIMQHEAPERRAEHVRRHKHRCPKL